MQPLLPHYPSGIFFSTSELKDRVETYWVRNASSGKGWLFSKSPQTLPLPLTSYSRIGVPGGQSWMWTPTCENTRITTSCWTIIDRKTLELTKKDTPHPKTKEKPQWDGRRGTITVKSNPITAGVGDSQTGEHLYKRSPPTGVKVLSPTSGSQPGGPAMGGGIPRESDFEA